MYRTFFRRLVTQIYSGTVQIYKFQQVGNSIINPPRPSHLPLQKIQLLSSMHCGRSVRIRSFSGPNFPTLGLNTEIYGASLFSKT